MEQLEATILLKNLTKRIRTQEDGSRWLSGVLTNDEVEALQYAVCLLQDGTSVPLSGDAGSTSGFQGEGLTRSGAVSILNETVESDDSPEARDESLTSRAADDPQIELALEVLTLPAPPSNVRLCVDFGTAMSKATLVSDDDNADLEDINVLQLGVPGDQEEVSESMLISSVYIDNDGLMWFGKAAVDRSLVDGADGSRQRIDNIKRRLSEDGWDEQVSERYNPTSLSISYADMVLAYLMFLAWTVTWCVGELGYPRNLQRRFAMPCLLGERRRETVHRLKKAVGEAQVLADTFSEETPQGISLSKFLLALKALRAEPRDYKYVGEDITEPLGVAGSMISWTARIDMLIMVVDVGAGTSDLSLFRINFDPNTGINNALEINGAGRGLPLAGNHLDKMLIELIIRKSEITSEHSMWLNVRSALELQIRDLKESLFNDGFVYVPLLNTTEVEIELDEFLALDPVRQFGQRLRAVMVDILESIDESWVNWVIAKPSRNLVIALTGGGAELPMVKELAEGSIPVSGRDIPVVPALRFPPWLREANEGLEADYPRIAVSLGGARKRVIEGGHVANITAGDILTSPTLGGYYTKGN